MKIKTILEHRNNHLTKINKDDLVHIMQIALSRKSQKVKEDWLEQNKLFTVSSKWNQIVGEALATHTTPTKIRENILHISSDHSVFLQQLQMSQKHILENIHEYTGFTFISLKIIIGKRL